MPAVRIAPYVDMRVAVATLSTASALITLKRFTRPADRPMFAYESANGTIDDDVAVAADSEVSDVGFVLHGFFRTPWVAGRSIAV